MTLKEQQRRGTEYTIVGRDLVGAEKNCSLETDRMVNPPHRSNPHDREVLAIEGILNATTNYLLGA